MTDFETIDLDLDLIVGGTNIDDIKNQARPYCPKTVATYDNVDPATITRDTAVKMGDECLAEMDFVHRIAAKGRIKAGIDAAFPK